MTDEKILELMREGKEEGLAAVMDKYRKLVISVVSGMLISKEDREEVAEDTFYKVWKCSDRIDTERGSLKNYICMVGRSVALNKLRTLSQTEPLPDDERDLGIEADFSTESAAEHNRKVIADCVRSMPSPEREIFVYRYYYSTPITIIAQKVGLNERKVEYMLHKCKRRLRDALTKGGILL